MSVQTIKKRVTLAQVAERAGVSQSAVSAILNNRSSSIRIGGETRIRIIEACMELDYRPRNFSMLDMIYPENGNVCFLLDRNVPGGIQHQYFGGIIEGVIDSLEDETESIIYSRFDSEIDYCLHPELLPKAILEKKATRFVAASTPNESLIRYLLENNLPVVCVGHVINELAVRAVLPDYAEATKKAVKYLVRLGHSDIAFITGPFGEKVYNAIEAHHGFAQGFRDVGLRVAAHLVCHCNSRISNFSREELMESVDRLMESDSPPSAIICLHDTAAITVCSYLQSRGFRVPDDVSVMGCNDEPLAATCHPSLTTIRFPLREMGKEAIRMVNKIILEKSIRKGSGTVDTIQANSRSTVLPVELIERESCGRVKS